MPQRKQHNLFSKGEVASLLSVTSQTFANWQARDDKFPEPTFANRAGNVALYTTEDVQKIHNYVTKAERERLEARDKALQAVLKGEAVPQLEGQTAIDEAEAEFQAAAPVTETAKPIEEPASAPVNIVKPEEAKPEPKAEAKTEPVKDAPKTEEPKPEAKADDKDKELVGAGAPAKAEDKAEDKPAPKTAPKARGSVLNKR